MLAASAAGLSLLAGCGGEAAKDSAPATKEAAAGPAGWNAADACSILSKEAVAEVLTQEVSDAQLSLVHEAGAAEAATSQCTYLGKDGASIATLMARWSPINDNTQAAIDQARSAAAVAIKAFTDKPIEDLPGLGKAAFITPGIDSLNVFVDDARMIIVTPQKLPDGALGKDIAVALAKKAGA
jgi:hypothetical protein